MFGFGALLEQARTDESEVKTVKQAVKRARTLDVNDKETAPMLLGNTPKRRGIFNIFHQQWDWHDVIDHFVFSSNKTFSVRVQFWRRCSLCALINNNDEFFYLFVCFVSFWLKDKNACGMRYFAHAFLYNADTADETGEIILLERTMKCSIHGDLGYLLLLFARAMQSTVIFQ